MLNTKITNNSTSEKLLKQALHKAVDIKLKNIELNINVLIFLKGQTNHRR